MFNRHHKSDLQEIERFSCALTEANAKLAAISRSMAMIEFDRNGVILDANLNFCKTMDSRQTSPHLLRRGVHPHRDLRQVVARPGAGGSAQRHVHALEQAR
ncbi:MAG: hypothetical protein MUW57_23985 [Pseudomonas sp.]|nr:hypothetical protein [Pseudomonas sp.]